MSVSRFIVFLALLQLSAVCAFAGVTVDADGPDDYHDAYSIAVEAYSKNQILASDKAVQVFYEPEYEISSVDVTFTLTNAAFLLEDDAGNRGDFYCLAEWVDSNSNGFVDAGEYGADSAGNGDGIMDAGEQRKGYEMTLSSGILSISGHDFKNVHSSIDGYVFLREVDGNSTACDGNVADTVAPGIRMLLFPGLESNQHLSIKSTSDYAVTTVTDSATLAMFSKYYEFSVSTPLDAKADVEEDVLKFTGGAVQDQLVVDYTLGSNFILSPTGAVINSFAYSICGRNFSAIESVDDADETGGGVQELSYNSGSGCWEYTDENKDGSITFNFNVTGEDVIRANLFSLNVFGNPAEDYEGRYYAEEIEAGEWRSNGAVLIAPYMFNTSSNWVRISNESPDRSAQLYLDLFDESGNNYVYDFQVAGFESIPPSTSVVIKADDIIAGAEQAFPSFVLNSKRFTSVFYATRDKDDVHGISVQAIPGGVDRVMPLLDDNTWSQ
ncbi:hypothetical protein [Limisalsivibrio acetivorans]|uniref:hypothetical protein n=1 Tax=Limisalsivibrio acetivorans TaxID=1304888 RepID=UPI0003B65140|nr:hypothetical protein [Limisalsivibrio acetivorans]